MTPSVLPAVARALNDPDPLVRVAAVEALANSDPSDRRRYLLRMLADPVRGVRIEAARALAGPEEARFTTDERTRSRRRSPSSSRCNATTQTDPRARGARQSLCAARQCRCRDYRVSQSDRTRSCICSGVRQSGRPLSRSWLRQRGGEGHPTRAWGKYRMPGLCITAGPRLRATETLRRRAEGACRGHSHGPGQCALRLLYAVALNDTGQSEQALKVLEAALKRQPYDRDLLSGLAFYTAQAGRRDVALGYSCSYASSIRKTRNTRKWLRASKVMRLVRVPRSAHANERVIIRRACDVRQVPQLAHVA